VISQKDIKLLWGRAASRCSICRIQLTQDKESTKSSFLVGEQAHIVAEQSNGPRGNSILPIEERNSYHNLILLCPTHHEMIDKNEEDFPIEKLHILKSRHELWVQDTLAKEASNTSKEFRPVSHLLLSVEEIKPFLFWLHRSVPPNKAKDFLSRLQSLWHAGLITARIDSSLTHGMDNLLRPLSSGHFLNKTGQNYVRSTLSYANRCFSRYFKDRGFAWDDIEFDFEIETILYCMGRSAKEIEQNNRLLDWDETNIVRLILYILGYCKAVQGKGRYITIPEGFVRQSHAVIEGFLENELGYKLPDAFDDDENENLRDLYEFYYSHAFEAG
jgi:hypothetical protein